MKFRVYRAKLKLRVFFVSQLLEVSKNRINDHQARMTKVNIFIVWSRSVANLSVETSNTVSIIFSERIPVWSSFFRSSRPWTVHGVMLYKGLSIFFSLWKQPVYFTCFTANNTLAFASLVHSAAGLIALSKNVRRHCVLHVTVCCLLCIVSCTCMKNCMKTWLIMSHEELSKAGLEKSAFRWTCYKKIYLAGK